MGMKWLRNNLLKAQNTPRKTHKSKSHCTKYCEVCHPKQTKSTIAKRQKEFDKTPKLC